MIVTVETIDFSGMLEFVQTSRGLEYNEVKPVLKMLVDLMLAECEDRERMQELVVMYTMANLKCQGGVNWERPVLDEDGKPHQ